MTDEEAIAKLTGCIERLPHWDFAEAVTRLLARLRASEAARNAAETRLAECLVVASSPDMSVPENQSPLSAHAYDMSRRLDRIVVIATGQTDTVEATP